MRISDWSSDVCSSDLPPAHCEQGARRPAGTARPCLGDQSDCARGMTVPDKVNLAAAFATFHDHWNPRVAGDINNFQVKLAKFAGKFDWHHHEIGRASCRERVCQYV